MRGHSAHGAPPKEEKFLKKVQHELEEQRGHWKDEVEKMADGFTGRGSGYVPPELKSHNGAGGNDSPNNSYVDTSSGGPVFKSFVDMSGYPPQGIDVSVDSIENKVVIKAQKRGADGIMRSFTQKVQLPRYSDESRVSTKMSKEGVLRIEVPLLFYFQPERKKSKSFINQVVTKPDGSKFVEVLVNVGHDIQPWNLRVFVSEDDELMIVSEVEKEYTNGQTKKVRDVIKRYKLPKHADINEIRSKLGRDGRLMVTVPLY